SIIDARVKPAHDVGEYFDNKSFRDGAAGPESRRRFRQRPSHAHACRGHPRLYDMAVVQTWMAGTSPAMTVRTRDARIKICHLGHSHFCARNLRAAWRKSWECIT
ncbi:MAG: hypothetical protein WA716_01180, partial [Pseudolabrys sp.]